MRNSAVAVGTGTSRLTEQSSTPLPKPVGVVGLLRAIGIKQVTIQKRQCQIGSMKRGEREPEPENGIQRDRNRTERGDRVERGKSEKAQKRGNSGGEKEKEERGERQKREDPS